MIKIKNILTKRNIFNIVNNIQQIKKYNFSILFSKNKNVLKSYNFSKMNFADKIDEKTSNYVQRNINEEKENKESSQNDDTTESNVLREI